MFATVIIVMSNAFTNPANQIFPVSFCNLIFKYPAIPRIGTIGIIRIGSNAPTAISIPGNPPKIVILVKSTGTYVMSKNNVGAKILNPTDTKICFLSDQFSKQLRLQLRLRLNTFFPCSPDLITI